MHFYFILLISKYFISLIKLFCGFRKFCNLMCTQSSIYAFWLLSDILCNRGLQKRATRSSRAVFKNRHFSRTTSHNQPVFENTKTFQVESPQLEALVFDHLPATTFRAKNLKFSFVFNLSETTTWLIMESKLDNKVFQLTLSHSWPYKRRKCVNGKYWPGLFKGWMTLSTG